MNNADAQKPYLVTLVGPPNSGKTTLFNLLSGKNYKTVNYPGSTVEYSTCKIQSKYGLNADILDSPGIISLDAQSPDEEVAINSLYKHPSLGTPSLVITTVDASQVSRHLLLSKQLIESGFLTIIVLTMNDILAKRGYLVDAELLSSELGCTVIKLDGRSGDGIDKLISCIKNNISESNTKTSTSPKHLYKNISKEKLLSLFNDIEQIEEKVVVPLKGPNDLNLKNANERLNILNPTLKYGINRPDELTLKIDKYLLHRKWGLFFFFIIMALTFSSIFWIAEPFMEMVDLLFGSLASSVSVTLGNNWYGDFLADGIISGTGAVLIFLPQILILFFILGLLEDTGYLARGAMLIDKPLSKIGLNGKSFVPMLSGFACAIPAMLAARTISNKRERFLTIFIIPLMSCSARLPVYTLLIAFLTPKDKLWIAGIALSVIYIASILGSILVAAVINKYNKSLIKTEDNSSFILELPAYRRPKAKVIVRNSLENAKQYIFRAGPTILVLSMFIWLLTYFPNHSPQIDSEGLSSEEIVELQKVERLSTSYASELGRLIQPIMTPLDMDWRIGVSLIAAFAAREVFVSSLAMIFKISDEDNIQESMISAMRNAKNENSGKPLFTTSTIVGLIVFFMFAMQCLSTVAVSRKETGGWRIPILQIIIFTTTAYVLTLVTVNFLKFTGLN